MRLCVKKLKFVVGFMVLLLTACGKNGALYLPDQAPDNKDPEAQSSSQSSSKPQEQN